MLGKVGGVPVAHMLADSSDVWWLRILYRKEWPGEKRRCGSPPLLGKSLVVTQQPQYLLLWVVEMFNCMQPLQSDCEVEKCTERRKKV